MEGKVSGFLDSKRPREEESYCNPGWILTVQRSEERQGSEQGDLRDGEGRQGRQGGKLRWFPEWGLFPLCPWVWVALELKQA